MNLPAAAFPTISANFVRRALILGLSSVLEICDVARISSIPRIRVTFAYFHFWDLPTGHQNEYNNASHYTCRKSKAENRKPLRRRYGGRPHPHNALFKTNMKIMWAGGRAAGIHCHQGARTRLMAVCVSQRVCKFEGHSSHCMCINIEQ